MTSRATSWPGSCAPPCRQPTLSILRVERAWQVARGQRHQTYPRPALSPDDAGQDRAISSLDEKPDPAGQLLPARTARTEHRGVRQLLQQLSIPREPGQPDAG